VTCDAQRTKLAYVARLLKIRMEDCLNQRVLPLGKQLMRPVQQTMGVARVDCMNEEGKQCTTSKTMRPNTPTLLVGLKLIPIFRPNKIS
jgi:hypothetical protein